MNDKISQDSKGLKGTPQTHSIDQNSIDMANELVNAIEILGDNVGADAKIMLVSNDIDYAPEDVIELSKQTPSIQKFIMKRVLKGSLTSIKEGLSEFVSTDANETSE